MRIWQRNRGRELQGEYISEIANQSEVTVLTDNQKAEFQKRAQGAYDWAAKEYGSAYSDLLEKVLEAAK